MLGRNRVGSLPDWLSRPLAAAGGIRAGASAAAVAVALLVGGSMQRASFEAIEEAVTAWQDVHDLRALMGGGAAHRSHAEAPLAPHPTVVRRLPVLDVEQQNVARFIARRYRVAIEQTQHVVEYAYRTASEFKVDPLLILAVISVESSFNPKAQSHQGAQGLMQVLTRVHAEKFEPFGGVAAAFDPLANIRVGAQILKEYLGRDGTVEGALKAYVGAALLPHDGGYGAKVLNERARIAAAAKGREEPGVQATRQASVDSRLRGEAPRARDI